AFYAHCLAAGHDFDWWPQLYGGVYLTGEGQAGTYHPLHLALYRCLPLGLAFNLEVWLNYPLMLLGTWLWLRRRLARAEIAMFGALVFTFSGFNLLHFVHVNAIAVVAHLPWLLWALDRAITGSPAERPWSLVIVSLLTASQILLGYPQYVWFSLLAESLYVASLAPAWPFVTRIGAAKLTGLLIGAIQWLPTVDALHQSIRTTVDAQFFTSGSLHPLNLVQLVAPYLFEKRVVGQNTHELGIYAGAVPCVLVAWLCFSRRPTGRNQPLYRFGCLLGLLALWLALGSYGYLSAVQSWLPVVGSFRFPCRAIVLFHLAVAVLAALALDQLCRRQRRGGEGWGNAAGVAWGCALAAMLTAALAPLLWSAHLASWPLIVAGPLLLGSAAWLLAQAARGVSWAPLALVVLTAVDQGLYGLSYTALASTQTLPRFAHDPAIQPAGPPGGRVALDPASAQRGGLRQGNQLLLAGWSRVGGYLGLPPQRLLDYQDIHAIRVAGARWVNSGPVGDTRAILFDQVDRPLDDARLVSRAIHSTTPAQDLKKIDVGQAALVARPLDLPPGPPGQVQTLKKSPGQLSLLAVAPTRQLLVVAESFHPGWQALIDGQPAAVRRVNGDFIGCEVPAGRHHVQLGFRPASLKKGTTFTCCGLGLMLCGFLATRRRQGRGA
nr:YfhO family protein [Planctomycetales bacterium]